MLSLSQLSVNEDPMLHGLVKYKRIDNATAIQIDWWTPQPHLLRRTLQKLLFKFKSEAVRERQVLSAFSTLKEASLNILRRSIWILQRRNVNE